MFIKGDNFSICDSIENAQSFNGYDLSSNVVLASYSGTESEIDMFTRTDNMSIDVVNGTGDVGFSSSKMTFNCRNAGGNNNYNVFRISGNITDFLADIIGVSMHVMFSTENSYNHYITPYIYIGNELIDFTDNRFIKLNDMYTVNTSAQIETDIIADCIADVAIENPTYIYFMVYMTSQYYSNQLVNIAVQDFRFITKTREINPNIENVNWW